MREGINIRRGYKPHTYNVNAIVYSIIQKTLKIQELLQFGESHQDP